MNSDPIADLLTRIRNATLVHKASVELPASKLKIELVKLLQNEGYIQSHELKEDDKGHQTLRLILKYDKDGRSVIRRLSRVSKPGLRKYSNVDNLPRVLSGAGVAVISTSKGLLSDRQARKERVGGEVLCYIQ